MNAIVLRIYVHHTRKRIGLMLFDWILAQARAMGIHGGSAFCATAGLGRHGVIHEQRFVEVAADVPIVVEFIVTDEEANRVLDVLRREKVHAFCTRTPAEVTMIN